MSAAMVAAVEALVSTYGLTAMVGDGVNDAPAMASARLPAGERVEALSAGALADPEAIAAVLRIAAGNFQLVIRLITQAVRIQEINRLESITSEVVAAARESPVIGTD